jgi:hypothetical protein
MNEKKEFQVAGRLATEERFSVIVKAYNAWHAMHLARTYKVNGIHVVAMSAFKVRGA